MNLKKIKDALSNDEKSIAYANYLRDKFVEDYNNRPAGAELGNGVEFDFIKKDGTIRHAVGTYKPWVNTSGVHKTPNPYQFSYYDLEKNSYRSFIITQLVIPDDFEVEEWEGTLTAANEESAKAAYDFVENWREFAMKPYGMIFPKFDYLKLSVNGNELTINGTDKKVVEEAMNFVLDGFDDIEVSTKLEEV